VERIKIVLPELLDLLHKHTTPNARVDFVQVGSNLWDLSQGCNNNPKNVKPDYQKIREIYEAVRGVLKDSYYSTGNSSSFPLSAIFWKLAPPVSLQYSNQMQHKHKGRVRSNQNTLNKLLQWVVTQDNLSSGWINWWQIVTDATPSEDILNDKLGDD
jgi:hypothetical protein